MRDRHSLLIVEDNPTLRKLLEYRLAKLHNVRTAGNGEEALGQVNAEVPDLIISDIMMPKMDGFALLSALQQNDRTRTIPFIFLTAKTDDLSKQKGMRSGVDDYITKPFDVDYLITRVGKILERKDLYQNQLDEDIGREFSESLMPKDVPQVPGYRVTFFAKPREHGGGDLFDWMEPKPGVFLFTIGDVMGKGLKAKFFAYSFLSYIRTTLHAMKHETDSPARLLQRVNRMLIQDQVLEETFASLLLIRWEPAQHKITYANAGHCRPILVMPRGPRLVEHSDLILGLDANAEYVDTTFQLPAQTALIGYTDALIEQPIPGGGQMGEKGVAISAAEAKATPQPIAHMLNAMLQRSSESQFVDDILVFWLERQ